MKKNYPFKTRIAKDVIVCVAIVLNCIFNVTFMKSGCAQTTCESAFLINQGDVFTQISLNNDSTYWIKFDGIPETMKLLIVHDNHNFTVSFYSNSCDSLNQILVPVNYQYDTIVIKHVFTFPFIYALIEGSGNFSISILKDNYGCPPNTDPCGYVLNGSFEDIMPDANPLWYKGHLHVKACWWDRASQMIYNNPSSPDLFQRNCSNPDVNIPSNWAGFQGTLENNEDYYAGIVCYWKNKDVPTPHTFREYISQDITSISSMPLEPGRRYVVGMYASLGDNSAFATNLGIYLGTNQFYQQCYSMHCTPFYNLFYESGNQNICYNLSPQVQTTAPLLDKNGWTLIVDTVEGNNQQQIIIGNFQNNDPSNFYYAYPGSVMSDQGADFEAAYYYIDHVFIYPEHKKNYYDICYGDCITLTSSAINDSGNFAPAGFFWSTDALNKGAQRTVCPLNDVLITCTTTDWTGCTIIDSFYIHVNSLPELPVIVGNHNNCDTITSYYIQNPQPNCIYNWHINNHFYSNDFPISNATNINIEWETLWVFSQAQYTYLVVECYDLTTGCHIADSIKIWKCCMKSPNEFINDAVISDASEFSNTLVFNGDIIIDNDITIGPGMNVIMAPESRIIVNTPYTFTINSSNVFAGCKYMWDGITINDSNAQVIIQNNSAINDAFNAVYSTNGGKFFLDNSKFQNNYISVRAEDQFFSPQLYTPALNAKITRCKFEKSGTGLIAPYLNHDPYYGVYADNVNRFTIGDSTNKNLKNTFKKMLCGIAGFNSSLHVYNNEFVDIQPPSPCAVNPGNFTSVQCNTAIHVVQTKQDIYSAYPSILRCGGKSGHSANTFKNCLTGIYTYQTLSLIRGNTLNKTNQCILLRDNQFNSHIIHNSMYDKITSGIRVINTLPMPYRRVTITHNFVKEPMRGIELLNVSSSPLANKQSVVASNEILLDGNTKSLRYGIKLDNCNQIHVACNNITRKNNTPGADKLKIRGIEINQTKNALVSNNTTKKLGLGIKGAGYLGNTQFQCNKSYTNHNGFYFEADYALIQTNIDDQVNVINGVNIPNDNQWFGSIGFDIDADLNFIQTPSKEWHYRVLAGHPEFYPNMPAFLQNYLFRLSAGNPAQTSCINCNPLLPGGPIEKPPKKKIKDIAEETNNYSELDIAFKHFEKQFAYKVLSIDSTGYYSEFDDFRSALANSNIGKYDAVDALVDNGDVANARQINESISPSNDLESNRKWINGIYFNYIIPQEELPQNIIDDLVMLAASSAYVYGDAVFIARAIVDYMEPTMNPKSMEFFDNSDNAESIYEVRVYPNPANDYMNIEFDGIDKQIEAIFSLTNALGVRVYEKSFNASPGIYQLDISTVAKGLYVFEVVLDNTFEVISKGRIVIQH